MTTDLEALGQLVKRAQYRNHRTMDTALRAVGVSLVQWDALRAVDRMPDASAHDLAVATFQSDQAFGTLAGRLVDRGLIERRAGRGRRLEHVLTEAGRSALDEGNAIATHVLADLFAPLAEPQRRALSDALRVLTADVGTGPGPRGEGVTTVHGEPVANRLGAYLQARRGLVTPEQAGLPSGGTRRVPGLRREEVAMLAGVSADYYLRLERGRDTHPSSQVLDALARVLLLDEVERRHLHGLAEPVRRSRPRRTAERVPPRLHQMLAALQVPAFIEGRAFDVLAANELATAFSPRLAVGQNRLRSLLLDPEERAFHRDWERSVAEFVGAFRRSVGDEVDDPRVVQLVGELSIASGRFRELWARQDVRVLEGGSLVVDHPVVGELHLHRDKLPVDGLLLVLYYADAGSASAERLALLASLTSTPSPGLPASPRSGD